METVTVIDVLRDEGVPFDKRLSWALGAEARDTYSRIYGHPPVKALDAKTCGRGSHCFARYPVEFRPTLVQLAKRHAKARTRQTTLF